MEEAVRRGLLATREIASILLQIRDDELWAGVSESFAQYLADRTPYKRSTADRLIQAELVCRTIEAAKLQLPQNESQALELSVLDENRQPIVWQRVLDICAKHEVNITSERIRDAVEQETARAEKKAAKGIAIDLDDDDELYLSEKGEEALARIKALCGNTIAKAIRQKTNEKLTEDSLRKWADQDDDTVKELPRYVIDKTWGVRKALNYISQIVEGDTEVDELVLLARDREGHFAGRYEDARIVIDIIT